MINIFFLLMVLKQLSQTYFGTRIEYSWTELPGVCWKVNIKSEQY